MNITEEPYVHFPVATFRFNGANDTNNYPVYKKPETIPMVKKFLSAGIVTFGMMYMDPNKGPFLYAKEGFIADMPCDNHT